MKLPKHLTKKVLEISGEPIRFSQNRKTRAKRDRPWIALSSVQTAFSVLVEIPVMVHSESNLRGHWAKRLRRKHEQWAACHAGFAKLTRPILPSEGIWSICLTRLYCPPGKPFDESALPDAFKGIQDWVADWMIPGMPIGIADGDRRLRWSYAQQKSSKVGIRIAIRKVLV